VTALLVLCDPALLIPPSTDDVGSGIEFWVGLIEWAADRRLRLGPASQEFLVAALASGGWPDFEPPACPAALKRNARQALNKLIGQVAEPSRSLQVFAPTFDPSYVRDAEAGSSIGRDAVALSGRELVGLATNTAHWSEPANVVRLEPPPPEELPFVLEPKQSTPGERDVATGLFFERRRITIVGGVPAPHLLTTLGRRFLIEEKQVEWIGSEKNQPVNLDALGDLRRERDVVLCISSHVGHDAREAAQKQCHKRGVEFRYVNRANEIANLLCDEFGLNV
jgi:hypothetical protein